MKQQPKPQLFGKMGIFSLTDSPYKAQADTVSELYLVEDIPQGLKG